MSPLILISPLSLVQDIEANILPYITAPFCSKGNDTVGFRATQQLVWTGFEALE